MGDPTPKRKVKSSWQLPPEVDAVLQASTNLRPCRRKYGRVPCNIFLEHIQNDRCAQCRDLLLQLDKEVQMMAYLRSHKN